jgi:hypothetical protein
MECFCSFQHAGRRRHPSRMTFPECGELASRAQPDRSQDHLHARVGDFFRAAAPGFPLLLWLI